MNIDSRILFIEIVNILKKIKNNPSQPKMIARDNKLEPRGSGNSANDFPDLTGDGKVTFADILKGRGVDIA